MQNESYVAQQGKFVLRQKLSPNLVFQIVARDHLNICNISTLAYD